MRKILPYILILTVILQIFAPFTIGMGVKNNLELQTNKAEAEMKDYTQSGITLSPEADITKDSIKITVDVIWGTSPTIALSSESIVVTLMTNNDEEIRSKKIENLGPSGAENQSGDLIFSNLEPNTTYKVIIKASQRSQSILDIVQNWIIVLSQADDFGEWTKLNTLPLGVGDFLFKPDESTGTITNYDNPYLITTLNVDDNSTQNQQLDNLKNEAAYLPTCGLGNWSVGGCVGIFIYRAIFQPSAYLFALTGKLLDFTFFYTIQDTSYRSGFVVEGWGIVRDLCNMFFIFILLYIAFGTILNLHGVKPKEMIINVVIIGLLINFSLFATQVIIDASNIMARVFYNQILVGNKDKNTNEINEELGLGGSKQLTVALINKINPQQIIINADKASVVVGKDTSTSSDEKNVNTGTFIMVAVLASIMNIVGLYVFFMVSLVFIARVIGLWLAMIVVPMAFFSYAVPQMQDMEMVGWKRWWPETFKMAFLAPVFIMFLYLIIMFLNSGMGVINANDKEGLDFFVAIIVPFAFLMILLLRAKDLTTKMSGKIGETLTGIAKTVGGAVVGTGLAVATGGAAMAMRGTLGKFGSSIANSEKLANMEAKGGPTGWMAGRLRDLGTGTSKASFDVRATKLGALAGKTGGFDMGKAKEGGFTKYKEEQKEKKKKRAQELKEVTTKREKNDVLDAQRDLDVAKTKATKEERLVTTRKVDDAGVVTVETTDRDLITLNKDLAGFEKALTASERAVADADRNIKNNTSLDPAVIKAKEDALTDAIDRRDIYIDSIKQCSTAIKSIETPIKDAETALLKAQNTLAGAGRKVLEKYATSIKDSNANLIESIFSFGQATKGANDQAAREILANLPQEKK